MNELDVCEFRITTPVCVAGNQDERIGKSGFSPLKRRKFTLLWPICQNYDMVVSLADACQAWQHCQMVWKSCWRETMVFGVCLSSGLRFVPSGRRGPASRAYKNIQLNAKEHNFPRIMINVHPSTWQRMFEEAKRILLFSFLDDLWLLPLST